MENFDLVVIGSGPGGYVASVRAFSARFKDSMYRKRQGWWNMSQLGLYTNKSSFKKRRSAEIISSMPQILVLLFRTMKSILIKSLRDQRSVADRLSKGVDLLFKKNNITKITGTAKLVSPDGN